jgi:hypothetical protein
MGIKSTTKYIKNLAGNLTEEAALTTTAGAADAQKIPALNAAGVLDGTIVNSTLTSAGVGDSGKVVALDAAGRISTTMMPVGVAADTAIITTSETLTAGDWVNIHESTGPKVRKADAATQGKIAMGFVLASFGAATAATVYFEGSNTAVTGQTAGAVFLSTTAGQGTATAPTGSGNVVQRIGFATSATSVNFQAQTPITLDTI